MRPAEPVAARRCRVLETDFLPGLAPSEPGTTTPVVVTEATRASWWVKSTDAQVVASSGQRRGFRHQLMHRGRVIQSGSGADYRRTFESQAAYFNERGVVPGLTKHDRPSAPQQ